MKTIILFTSLMLVSCAASANPPTQDTLDSGMDSGNHNNGDLCCRVNEEIDGSPYIGGYYSCDPDAGIYTTPIWLPWVCNSKTTHEDTCQDNDCVIGSSCHAYDGEGLVEACRSK